MKRDNANLVSRAKSQEQHQDSQEYTIYFRLYFSESRVEDYPLSEKNYSIGRALKSNIRIPSTAKFLGVSLNHGTIEIKDDKIFYIDHSTNGTYLSRKGADFKKMKNNKKYRLMENDILKFDTLMGEVLCEDISTPKTMIKKDLPIRSTIIRPPTGPEVPKHKFLRSSEIANGEKIELVQGLNRIGRHYDNNIVIEDKNEYCHVSRFHGEIYVEGLKWWFKDIGSAHGSHIKTRDGNFYKLKANQLYPLTNHCMIRLGLPFVEGKDKACDLHFFEEE